MQDAIFVSQIKRSEVVLVSGATEHAGFMVGGLSKRHKWTASFSSYGTQVISEIWYDPEPTKLDVGVHEMRHFFSINSA